MHTLIPYAALLGLMFVTLSVRTIRLRQRLGIGLGDGGNETLRRAMRVHANFAEYVPLGLILIFLVEEQGAPAILVHGLCLGVLLGRVSHAWGVSQAHEDLRFRVFGMAMTFTSIATAAFYLLYVFSLRPFN